MFIQSTCIVDLNLIQITKPETERFVIAPGRNTILTASGVIYPVCKVLERTVADHLGIDTTVCSIVDILKKQAV